MPVAATTSSTLISPRPEVQIQRLGESAGDQLERKNSELKPTHPAYSEKVQQVVEVKSHEDLQECQKTLGVLPRVAPSYVAGYRIDSDSNRPSNRNHNDSSTAGKKESSVSAAAAAPLQQVTAHRFRAGKELQRSIESRRFKGKWAEVRGVAEENDSVTAAGGFTLSSPGREDEASSEHEARWQAVPPAPPAELVFCPAKPEPAPAPARFGETEVCVVNCDTLNAALVLGDACALNFANADTPGGRYRSGGRAQEEDLCRLLPQLYPSLLQVASSEGGTYPLPAEAALLSRNLLAVRQPGSYRRRSSMGEVTVISAAMPCGVADRRPRGGWAGSAWAATVTLRIRAALHAAAHSGHPNLVLGAFGCGAFGNPAGPVAAIFREQLESPEFRGRFEKVVFAVLDPLGTGNLGPFRREMRSIGKAAR